MYIDGIQIVAVEESSQEAVSSDVSSIFGVAKRKDPAEIFADAGDEEVKCTAVVDELKLKLEARNRVARGMDAFPWMSYPPAKSPAAAEVW